MKIFNHPFKLAIYITIIFVIVIVIFQVISNAPDYFHRRRLEKEIRVMQSEINGAQKAVTAPIPRRTRRIEMILNPGEISPKIQTHGDSFSYRFYGTMKMHLYRSEHVYETLSARNGSYEISIRNNVLQEIKYVVFERPTQCNTPLAFTIEVLDP